LAAATDEELVAGCLSGDDRAWDALIDRYAAYIYAIAVRAFSLRPDAADEVFQDVCIRLSEGLKGYSGKGQFRSWLRAVVVRACRDHLRREARRAPEQVEPAVDDRIDMIETALVVRAAVDALGEPCSTTIALHFFADLTQAEVAERLSVPSGTVAARLSRCVRRLRDALQGSHGSAASRG
jgi:RNA polymerase sigma-70 factor (ECF subfamily)